MSDYDNERTFAINSPLKSKITLMSATGLLLSTIAGTGVDVTELLGTLKPMLPPALYSAIWISRVFFTRVPKNTITGVTALSSYTEQPVFLLNSALFSKIQWFSLLSAVVHAIGNSLVASSVTDEVTMRTWLGAYDKVAFALLGIFRVWFTGNSQLSVPNRA